MKTWEKVTLYVLCLLMAVGLALLIVANVYAEDNDFGICTDPQSVNYPGVETLDALKESGFRPVNDGSCYYLKCVEAVPGDPDFAGVYSCDEGTADDQNYWGWVNDLLPGMTYGPAYYGKLIDVGGCTDPEAVNFMDQIWFPDYNIIDDGSCVYPEPALELDNWL